jgi:serine/threonine kinase 32
MDQEGHIHLSDFNIASQIHSNKPLTSLSGTAAYFGK